MRLLRRDPAAAQDRDEVVGWRASRLRGAGLSSRLAGAIARDPAYDLHAILELRDRGCPAELAARIVAPIDGGPQS